MISVRQATLDLFRSHGLTTWFGNPGSSELTLLEDFPEDFRYVLGLQEMVPVGMADAYAQITRTTRCGERSHRARHGQRPGRALQRIREQDPVDCHRRKSAPLHAKPVLPADQHRPDDGAQAVREVGGRTGNRERGSCCARPCHPLGDNPADGAGVRVVADGRHAGRTRRHPGRGRCRGARPQSYPRRRLSRRSRRGDLCAHRGRDVTGADRGWRCGPLRRVGCRDRVGRTHPVCRVDGPNYRVEWIPRESPVVSGPAAARCGLGLPSVNGPRLGGGDRRTGVPVLPASPRTLSTPRHKPDSHHQRSRRSRPRPGGGRDHRRRAQRRPGPARCGQTNPAARSTAARPDPRRRARGNTAQTRITVGGRRVMPHPQTRSGSARPAATRSRSPPLFGPATRSRT